MESSELRKRLDNLVARREILREQVSKKKEKEEVLREDVIINTKAGEVLTKLVESILDKNVRLVEKLVTFGLKEVFFPDKNLSLKLEQTEKRGHINLEPITSDLDHKVEGPVQKSFGGGVVQVQSFLFLIMYKVLLKSSPLLFLDESFSNVSEEYQPRVGELMSALCKRFNMIIVLVTHNQSILEHADVIYEAKDKSGELILHKKEAA